MIKFNNSRACFSIHQESEGIFMATLVSFQGKDHNSPPKEIVMVKSVRSWAGSVEDEALLREIGEFIDQNWPQFEKTEQ